MSGETDINILLKTLTPKLNVGDYVYCTVNSLNDIDAGKVLGSFNEAEGCTIILKKEIADDLGLSYSYITAWITLTVHSSLEGVGLTAAFSSALAKAGIGCNVVAAYYHDHIFIAKADAEKAMGVLKKLSNC